MSEDPGYSIDMYPDSFIQYMIENTPKQQDEDDDE